MNYQNHTFEITADNQPTVLERLLQVTRYRGFLVTGFNVYPNPDNDLLDITLTVQNPKEFLQPKDKGIRRLHDQLDKLYDINCINIKQPSTIKCQA